MSDQLERLKAALAGKLAIEREIGVVPELIPAGKGVFDVVADDRLIFSKYDAGRFPDDGEVISALAG